MRCSNWSILLQISDIPFKISDQASRILRGVGNVKKFIKDLMVATTRIVNDLLQVEECNENNPGHVDVDSDADANANAMQMVRIILFPVTI